MIADCVRADVKPVVDYDPEGPAVPTMEGDRSGRWNVAFESILAAALLVLASPVILLTMALVKLTSRGPVIYSQVRVGLRGRSFVIYKIRTMTHDCERMSGPRWSVGRDARVTPLGRILRQLHLDELPQLWNVMRGDMGLVGPRPERPEFVSQLEKVIPRYRERLEVRPGVTGLAQVQLPPDTDLVSVRRKVACDLAYIRQSGPWLDLRIFVATLLIVLHFSPSSTRMMLGLPTGEEYFTPSHDSSIEISHGARFLAP